MLVAGDPMIKIFALALLIAGCGDNLPAPAPDASTYPRCVDLGCSATAVTRECAATGVCYCDTGTKTDPMPQRCDAL